MDSKPSWLKFRGLLPVPVQGFTIPMVSGTVYHPYGIQGTSQKSTRMAYRGLLPVQGDQDKGPGENVQPWASQHKPTTKEHKMIYLLMIWGISLGIITYLWVLEDAAAGRSDFLQQAFRTSQGRVTAAASEIFNKNNKTI